MEVESRSMGGGLVVFFVSKFCLSKNILWHLMLNTKVWKRASFIYLTIVPIILRRMVSFPKRCKHRRYWWKNHGMFYRAIWSFQENVTFDRFYVVNHERRNLKLLCFHRFFFLKSFNICYPLHVPPLHQPLLPILISFQIYVFPREQLWC